MEPDLQLVRRVCNRAQADAEKSRQLPSSSVSDRRVPEALFGELLNENPIQGSWPGVEARQEETSIYPDRAMSSAAMAVWCTATSENFRQRRCDELVRLPSKFDALVRFPPGSNGKFSLSAAREDLV